MSAPTGYKQNSIPNMSPEQMNLFKMLIGKIGPGAGQGVDFLSKLASGDESTFSDLEAPAYAGFNKTLGQIGSRFSQFGARDSSAFENAVSGAGSDLAQKLQSQRLGLQNDAVSRLLGYSNNLLGQKPYENTLQEDGMPWGDLIKILPQLLSLL